jgi:hypothetical protein
MLRGEAYTAPDTAQLGVGVAARNRFNSPYFSGSTNYQNTITCNNPCQFNGIATQITNGPENYLDNAVSVWLGNTGNFITPSGKNPSQCFFSPSDSQWTSISNALQSGTTSEAGIPNQTTCFSGAPNGQQIRVVSGVGTNPQSNNGAPNFVFHGARSSSSDPVVVSVN